MATIGRESAEKLIEKVKKQKRPRVYIIIKYWNTFYNEQYYAYCDNEVQYQAIMSSSVFADVEVLWANEKFLNPEKRKKEIAKAKAIEELRKTLGLF